MPRHRQSALLDAIAAELGGTPSAAQVDAPQQEHPQPQSAPQQPDALRGDAPFSTPQAGPHSDPYDDPSEATVPDDPPRSVGNDAFSVSELTRLIKDRLEGEFAQVWLEAEVSQFTEARSGHIYLTFKDAHARIDAVVWRNLARTLDFDMRVGLKVLALGKVSVYAPRGDYQFIVEKISDAGAGALEAAFRALRAKLLAEGLFDRERKQRLPFLPRKVGAITSGTGAARRDIEAVLHRRSPQIPLVLYPARVQGEGAAADVARGLARLAKEPEVDVIIVGRGGGSIEDLWAFNEEVVVRAIAACPKPVISAVGHETDTTLSDLVADHRAATPSAAAEAAVPVRNDMLFELDELSHRMTAALERRIERRREHLNFLQQRLSRALKVDARRLALKKLERRLEWVMQQRLVTREQALSRLQQRLARQHPKARLARARQTLDVARARLSELGFDHVQAARADFRVLLGKLHTLSPLASLGRGYSITRRPEGPPVASYDDVQPGESIQILLRNGWIEAEVTGAGKGLPSGLDPESSIPDDLLPDDASTDE
ncbi:MAG: exodeoxyribonuclease VII large subunit [Bradymonadia bacterium]